MWDDGFRVSGISKKSDIVEEEGRGGRLQRADDDAI
jgi:hypothetical protein